MTSIALTARRARQPAHFVRASALAMAAAAAALAASAFAQAAPTQQTEQAAPAQATGIPAWGLASSDLPADPSVRFGVLPNGMRYALKHNETPKGAAVIRFAFDVGMREAEPAQAGAPHFLEHMAFNGSTNIPEGELVKRLERLGLAFGADTNAETDLEHTTYKLDLPNTKPETVDGGLTFMREIASELALDKGAVDRERGILLSEFRVRDVPQMRRTLDAIGKQIPDPRFGPGLVGTPQSIANITADQLRAFYEGYYRPERATLVMVGDFDVAAMEQDVRKRFSDWQGNGTARANYVPTITPATTPTLATFTDPAVPEIIQFDRVMPYTAPANDVAEKRREMLESIAGVALTNRFSAIGRKPDSPIIFGQAAVQDLARTARSATAVVVAKDGQWQAALGVGEQQLRQAIQFGFTAAEIAEAKANLRTALENAVKQEAGRPSSAIADRLAGASLSDSVYLAPAANLALYNALEPTLTAEAAGEAFRAAWNGGPSLVHVATKQALAGGDAAVSSALASSAKIAVAAPVEEAAKAFAYDDFGPAGKIVSDTTIADLGIRTIRFANGVELNLKKTDFEPGKIAWYAKVGSGAQVFPADKPGLPVVAQLLTSIDGLKKHNVDELRRITAGRQVGIGLSVGEDGLVAAGGTTAADLGLQMKLLAAELTDPAYDPATEAQWAGMGPVISKNIMSNPSQLAALAVPWILTGEDGRFGLGDGDQLAARTLDEMKAVLAPQLATGAIRIGLVGDIPEDAAIAAVAQSLAALPARGATDAAPISVKPAQFIADRKLRTLYHAGSVDQGAIALSWPTTDDKDFKGSLTRDLLAEVMGLRLIDVVREELGATYTPSAGSVNSATYKGFGYLTASAPAAQGSMDAVAKAIRQIAADLGTAPPSADELLRARKPIVERWKRQARENGSWVGLVVDAQDRPKLLDRRRTRTAVLETIVPADLTAPAKRYLDPAAALEIRVIPRPAPAAALPLATLALSLSSGVTAQERTITPDRLAGPLAGTLLVDVSAGAPAAVLISGSGPIDRNGNGPLGLKASSYRLLAEGLAAHGVSTLRADKRGMFASSKAIADANAVTVDDYADDALAWAADLRDATGDRCVWLMGHSEGGLVALAAAARAPEGICGVVLIASPGRPLGKVLYGQLHANPANEPVLRQADAAIAALEKGERYDTKDMHPALMPLFNPAVQGFLISLFAADPAVLVRASKLPLLIVSGQEDLQVSEADADALSAARPDATMLSLPGVNHVLKAVPAGDKAANVASYADSDRPLAPGLAEAVAAFMKAAR